MSMSFIKIGRDVRALEVLRKMASTPQNKEDAQWPTTKASTRAESL